MSEEPWEADEADTAEQRMDVPADESPRGDEAPAGEESAEADPVDAAEQHRPVPLDEDDYR